MSNPQSQLYNVLHILSSKWSKYPKPVMDYKFLIGTCPVCKVLVSHAKVAGITAGLTRCPLCKGRGKLPNLEIDLAWPDIKFGIEVQGGIWMKGKSGHSSGVGIQRDILKQQLAIRYGWTLVPVSSADVDKSYILNWIAEFLTDAWAVKNSSQL